MISPQLKEVLLFIAKFEEDYYNEADYGEFGDLPPERPTLEDLLAYVRKELGKC